MITIRLIDARRGLHQQCESLFKDKMVADQIYRYLCDGLEECEEVEPEREKGNWVGIDDEPCETFECDVCGFTLEDWIQGAFYNYCPNCGADMREREKNERFSETSVVAHGNHYISPLHRLRHRLCR